MRSLRIQKEVQRLSVLDHITQVDIIDFDTIKVSFKGPQSSPFENNILTIFFSLPSDYPHNPPVLCFESNVFHPNVSSRGVVCGGGESWTMFMTMELEIERLCTLLVNPLLSDPLNINACEIYNSNKSEYCDIVRQRLA